MARGRFSEREPDLDSAVDMAAFTAQSIGSSAAATFVVAVDGTIVSWSDEAARLFRRPAWDAVGRPCHEVVGGLELDGTEGCTEKCPIRLQCRLGVAPPSRDLLAPRSPGADADRMLRVHHVTLNDPLGYVAGVLHVVEPVAHPHRSRPT